MQVIVSFVSAMRYLLTYHRIIVEVDQVEGQGGTIDEQIKKEKKRNSYTL